MSENQTPDAERTLRILFVDDNQANQMVGAALLKRSGHEVTIAKDGNEALDWLDKATFDVILMDVEMPNLNGIEATKIIRQREAGTSAHIPIIALTSHAAERDRQRTLAAGMDEHVAKPFERTALLACIERVLSGRSSAEAYVDRTAKEAADRILNGVEGNRDLLLSLARIFLDDVPVSLSKIRSGIENSDYELVARTAHTLRGSAAIFGAHAVVMEASRLENAAQDEAERDRTPWKERVSSLESALTEFTPVLIATSGIDA